MDSCRIKESQKKNRRLWTKAGKFCFQSEYNELRPKQIIEMNSSHHLSAIAVLLMLFTSCQSGTECLEQLKVTHKSMSQSFQSADSVAVVTRISEARILASCVKESDDLTVEKKGEAVLIMQKAEEMATGLGCRCYTHRMEEVFEAMSEAENMNLDQWKPLYAQWGVVNEMAGVRDIKFYLKSCTKEDGLSIAAMNSQVQTWNGYHKAGNILNDLESAIDNIISTGEGILNRLIEKSDEMEDKD